MARKHKHEEHENHERWLVSYADFITLLFAFFVVMYSVSSVNEGKYRVLSDSLTAAFRQQPHSMTPIQVGESPPAHAQGESPAPGAPTLIYLPVPVQTSPERAGDDANKQNKGKDKDKEKGKGKEAQQQKQGDKLKPLDGPSFADPKMGEIADQITDAMGGLIKDDLIKVRRDERWLEVEITSSILFPSGSARLTQSSHPMLEDLAKILAPFPNPIHVEGFTDNIPIHSIAFLSNWELSAARAASVVHLFMQSGIAPERMAAIGYGEFKAVADNATPEGRAKNRRVVLVVMPGEDPRWAKTQPKSPVPPAEDLPEKTTVVPAASNSPVPVPAVPEPTEQAPTATVVVEPAPAESTPTVDDPFISPNAPPPVDIGAGGRTP